MVLPICKLISIKSSISQTTPNTPYQASHQAQASISAPSFCEECSLHSARPEKPLLSHPAPPEEIMIRETFDQV